MFHQNVDDRAEQFYLTAESNVFLSNLAINAFKKSKSELSKIHQIKSIFFTNISVIKNNIFSIKIHKEFNIASTGTNLIPQSLELLSEIIEKEPLLSKIAYQRLSLESKEELKGALHYIGLSLSGYWKSKYQNILNICSFPIEKAVERVMPTITGFQLLNNKTSFFYRLNKEENPIDIEQIEKDDRLIVRVWQNKDSIITGVSFEVQEYRRKGSLYLTPIHKMQDAFKRVFFNDYISLSSKQKQYQDSLQILSILNQSMHAILPSIFLTMIMEYLNPTVASLIEADITAHGSQPTHTFSLSNLSSEKIWEYLVKYDYSIQMKSRNPYFFYPLPEKTDNILDQSFYLLTTSISEFSKKDPLTNSFYTDSSYESRVNKFLNSLQMLSQDNENKMLPNYRR